jgi:hypothetical protein
VSVRTYVIPFYYGSGSGSRTVIIYGSGSDFLARCGSCSASKKATVPVPQRCPTGRTKKCTPIIGKTNAVFPFQSYDSHIAMNPGYVRRHVAGTAKDAARTDSLWRLTRSFRVHVLLATYVNVKARMENILPLIDL